MTKSASDGISFLFGGTSEHEYTQDEVVELCKKEQQTTVYTGENYQVELTGTQFVLVHPVSENETFDSFDELVESHPVCEEARGFFN